MNRTYLQRLEELKGYNIDHVCRESSAIVGLPASLLSSLLSFPLFSLCYSPFSAFPIDSVSTAAKREVTEHEIGSINQLERPHNLAKSAPFPPGRYFRRYYLINV
jgi:hypothetical protein